MRIRKTQAHQKNLINVIISLQQAPNVTMNTMGPMGGGVQSQPAPPYRQAGGKPGAVNVGGVGQANVGLQPNQHMQSVSSSPASFARGLHYYRDI
jgi:hypothetical protein